MWVNPAPLTGSSDGSLSNARLLTCKGKVVCWRLFSFCTGLGVRVPQTVAGPLYWPDCVRSSVEGPQQVDTGPWTRCLPIGWEPCCLRLQASYAWSFFWHKQWFWNHICNSPKSLPDKAITRLRKWAGLRPHSVPAGITPTYSQPLGPTPDSFEKV